MSTEPNELSERIALEVVNGLTQRGVLNPESALMEVIGIAEDLAPYLAPAQPREVWEAAILIIDTAPLCHVASKQYIDPVPLIQRMNAALEAARDSAQPATNNELRTIYDCDKCDLCEDHHA